MRLTNKIEVKVFYPGNRRTLTVAKFKAARFTAFSSEKAHELSHFLKEKLDEEMPENGYKLLKLTKDRYNMIWHGPYPEDAEQKLEALGIRQLDSVVVEGDIDLCEPHKVVELKQNTDETLQRAEHILGPAFIKV